MYAFSEGSEAGDLDFLCFCEGLWGGDFVVLEAG